MAGEDGPGDDVRVVAADLDPAEHRIWLAVIYDDSLAAAGMFPTGTKPTACDRSMTSTSGTS
jgi:hypothetical protein